MFWYLSLTNIQLPFNLIFEELFFSLLLLPIPSTQPHLSSYACAPGAAYK
jgi:hypothetical protein